MIVKIIYKYIMIKIIIFILFLFFLYLIIFKTLKKYNFDTKIKKWSKEFNNYSHNVNNLGYRSDCSGFVSYMWDLDNSIIKGGPRTRGYFQNNLLHWGKRIKKTELQRGDILLLPNKHVIMFDKWFNKNFYYLYEVCNIPNCRGFTHKLIKFPYDQNIRPDFKNPIFLRSKFI